MQGRSSRYKLLAAAAAVPASAPVPSQPESGDAIQDVDVNDFDPLSINTDVEALNIVDGLKAGNPGVRFFEASRHYKCVSMAREFKIRLVRSLKIDENELYLDVNNLHLLVAEGNAVAVRLLQNLKSYSISHAKKSSLAMDIVNHLFRYPVALVNEYNVVTYTQVRLSHTLVIYPRKKNKHDRRFSVVEKRLSEGNYGEVFLSQRSISFTENNYQAIKIKNKKADKWRVVKIQNDTWSKSRQALVADIEYQMTSTLAPELAVKPLAKHAKRQSSAMLMRYFPGHDLNTIINCNGLKTDLERLEICLAAAEALKTVHDRGGIHRDIKPDNFMVVKGSDGVHHLKLIDFGLSILKSQEIRGVAGTLIYMAPEILSGEKVSEASDIYSLCRLYETIFGKSPSWETLNTTLMARSCLKCAEEPFDVLTSGVNAPNHALLAKLGLDTLLDSMRTQDVSKRMPLLEVIDRLKALISALKLANESRSIFSSAASAAAESPSNQRSCLSPSFERTGNC